MTENTFL